jgi:radical SAM protein with 4Fe4S-binding SPASM domain
MDITIMFKKVYVEITNNCNLDCSFCIGNKREKKFIDIDSYEVLLNKLEGYTDYLYFHVMGEPLLHPKINDLINIASKKYNINITTNGYLINRIKNNKNIRQINISLHSFDDKYKTTLDEYMNNIFDSVDELSKNTYIEYRMWVDNVNKDKIINKLEEKYNISIGDIDHITLDKNVFYQVEQEFIWPDINNSYYEEEGTCMGTRSHIGILVDGTVVPCCLDSNGSINLGNIYESSLDDILNGELYSSIKEGFLNNKKIHPMCRHCNFYKLKR